MRRLRPSLAVLILVAPALVASVLASASCAPALPNGVRDELARAPRGTVTVVFFTDFQCPFCRRTHAALAPLVEARAGEVRVVLRHVPLRSHPDARTAARAAVCAERLAPPEVAEGIVHALFTAPDVGEEACEALAIERGIGVDAYRRCVADPTTEARLERDRELYVEAGGDGVPLLYVDRIRLDGGQSRASLEAALDEARGAR